MSKYVDIFFIYIIPIIAIAITFYLAESINFQNPFRKRLYKNLYGNYRMYNFSREHKNLLVIWHVRIYRRLLKTPRITMEYVPVIEQNRCTYKGYIKIAGQNMMMKLVQETSRNHDEALIIFKPPKEKIYIRVGILSGFDEDNRPYAGIHLLCKNSVPESEVREVLGDSSSLDWRIYEERLDKILAAKGIKAN